MRTIFFVAGLVGAFALGFAAGTITTIKCLPDTMMIEKGPGMTMYQYSTKKFGRDTVVCDTIYENGLQRIERTDYRLVRIY